MQIAMETFFLPEFLDFCRKKLRQNVLCNGAQVLYFKNENLCILSLQNIHCMKFS